MSLEGEMYPVVIVQDRYGGVYSGGEWLAVQNGRKLENGAYRIIRVLDGAPFDDDVEAHEFWSDPPAWIAAGKSPNEAVAALEAKLSSQ